MASEYLKDAEHVLKISDDVDTISEYIRDGHIKVDSILPSRFPIFYYAIAKGRKNVVKYLIDAGADVSSFYQGVPMIAYAAYMTDGDVLQKFIDKGADVNARITTGTKGTALITAVSKNMIDSVKFLINHGADMNISTIGDAGGTALMHAIASNHHEITNMLIEKGADVNAKNEAGNTALDTAISLQPIDHDLCKRLIEKGADVNARALGGLTPLVFYVSLAEGKTDKDVLSLMLSKVTDINAHDDDGYTALHYAAKHADTLAITALVEKGADKSFKNLDDEIPLDLLEVEDPRLIELLTPDGERYKGYSKSDADLFNQLFAEPNEWSCCPVCLAYVRREDGCMYMRHMCAKEDRHEQLFQLYKDVRYKPDGEIEWCTICGRICYGHKHYAISSPNLKALPAFAPVSADAPVGHERHFEGTCIRVGGGGFEEKVRRIHRLLGYACELQDEVGKIRAQNAKRELVEEVWKAGDIRNRKVAKMIDQKKFEFPCTFPEDALPAAAIPEADAPDIPRPDDEKDLIPIKHEAPDNECIAELGAHEDNRPVYQFQHKQPDGSVYKHEAYYCGEDLETLIRSQPIDGKCRIEPDKCKALLYPEEVKDIVTPEFYETYRKLFNKANKKGGAIFSLMKPLNMDTAECAPPPKATGTGRKTYRKRKSSRKTRSRKSLR